MVVWLFSFLFFISSSMAEIGKISKILGGTNAYIMRKSEKLKLNQDTSLEQGDQLHTLDSVVLIHLYPSTQIGLSKNTQLNFSESLVQEFTNKEKAFSIIDFIKGMVRIQVTKDPEIEIDQKIRANGVSFAIRGTEFEISDLDGEIDLDVIEGQVEVSSPYVQTFVPEMVNPNEGFSFNKKEKKFRRRKFLMKFKSHPGFTDRREILNKWKNIRLKKRGRRAKRRS